ncbi:MAG: thiamine-phosphate kinase [Acidobacteriota bacterium]|nr:thiamine-phosphate kinase [Acidobacteriota bacterium]
MRETELVERIRNLAGSAHRNRGIIKGIGDDCAILRPKPNQDLVFTTDFVLEGRHFTLSTHTPAEIGHKALARSLSDLAAMGSEPVFCLVSLAAPQNLPPRWVDNFYKGLLALANKHKISLAGGDLSQFDKVIADVMCCGRVPKGGAILRSGALPGDRIFVTGTLGGAAKSLWRRKMEPRVVEGRALRGRASAGMDLSDGLSLDLRRLCIESRVSADLNSSAIPVARGATLEQALHGGEDYELLFTASPGKQFPKLPVTHIGVITNGKPGEIRLDGNRLAPKGFDHFA